MSILVSVCCTVYNHEKYLKETINGFLMQKTNFKFEVILNDDASTDKSADILRSYEKKYPDTIKPIYQTINQYSKNVNICQDIIWPKAMGKYIALCEGDDYWTDPNKLQKQFDYMESNPECSFCFHNAKIIVNETQVTEERLIKKNEMEKKINVGEMALLGFIPTASFFFYRTSTEKLPDWFRTTVVGDYPIQLLMTSHGYAHCINETMSAYRTGIIGSATSRFSEKTVEEKVNYISGFISILDNINKNTNFCFTSQLDQAKIPWEIQIVVLQKNSKLFRNERFCKYYDSLGIIRKIQLNFQCEYPKLYLKLAIIKNDMKYYLIRLTKRKSN